MVKKKQAQGKETKAETIFEFCSRFNSQGNGGTNGLEVCSKSCVIKSNSLDSRPYHRAFRSYGRTEARELFDRSFSFENYGLLFSHPVFRATWSPFFSFPPSSFTLLLSFVFRLATRLHEFIYRFHRMTAWYHTHIHTDTQHTELCHLRMCPVCDLRIETYRERNSTFMNIACRDFRS